MKTHVYKNVSSKRKSTHHKLLHIEKIFCRLIHKSMYLHNTYVHSTYCISVTSFHRNYSFLNLTLCAVTFVHSTYRCGNYSSEETIQRRKLFAKTRYLVLAYSNYSIIRISNDVIFSSRQKALLSQAINWRWQGWCRLQGVGTFYWQVSCFNIINFLVLGLLWDKYSIIGERYYF